MKDVLGTIKGLAWGALGPIRRPISRRVHATIARGASSAIEADLRPSLGEVGSALSAVRREVGAYRSETNLCLDALVRELTRLQDEVAELRLALADLGESRGGLSLVIGDARAESA